MRLIKGFDDKDHDRVADLYWQAFGGKLGRVMGPDARGRAYVARVLRADHAITAYDGDQVLGVVGFKTAQGALVGGGWRDLWAVYGVGAVWRAVALMLLERDVDNARFLMDGVFVAEGARGRGIGRALLLAIRAEAGARGYDQVRLDVVDGNDRARALYEREGFIAVDHQPMGMLSRVFGFDGATTMVAPAL